MWQWWIKRRKKKKKRKEKKKRPVSGWLKQSDADQDDLERHIVFEKGEKKFILKNILWHVARSSWPWRTIKCRNTQSKLKDKMFRVKVYYRYYYYYYYYYYYCLFIYFYFIFFRYKEVCKYDFDNPGWSQSTGHFTQLVWRSTEEVGLGWSSKEENGLTCYYVAARYSPGGNIDDVSRFKENVKKGSFDSSFCEAGKRRSNKCYGKMVGFLFKTTLRHTRRGSRQISIWMANKSWMHEIF